MCCAAHQRKKLESQGQGLALLGAPRTQRLCRYITRPAIASERLTLNRAGDVVLQLKSPYHDGTTHVVMSPLELMQRLAALVPRPRLHLIASMADAKTLRNIAPRADEEADNAPIQGRGLACLTAHEPGTTVPLDEKAAFKIPIPLSHKFGS